MAEQNFTSGSFMSPGQGEAVGPWTMYRWIPVVASFIMFAWACMIGANDVATSFGTSVGSGALTMLQAVLLAVVMEITGAVFRGSRVIDPLHAQVLKEGPPTDALLMWGLFIALMAATIWLVLATHWGLPVTSSLTLWGSLIGIALTTHGMDGVYWIEPGSPYIGGILGILVSWFLAPLLAAVVAFLFFSSMKIILLRAEEVEKRALRALPFYYGITVTVCILFIIYEATPATALGELGKQKGALIAGFSGVLSVILAYLIVIPLLQKRLGCFIAAKEESLASQLKACPEREEDAKAEEPSLPAPTKEMTAEDYFQQFNDLRCLETVHEENGVRWGCKGHAFAG